MQLLSWITWILSLALAVGSFLNISLTLEAQTEVLSWEQKYVLIIHAAWPMYVAFALALAAGIGSLIDLSADGFGRSHSSPAPSSTASTQSMAKKTTSQPAAYEGSYLSHLEHEQSMGRALAQASHSQRYDTPTSAPAMSPPAAPNLAPVLTPAPAVAALDQSDSAAPTAPTPPTNTAASSVDPLSEASRSKEGELEFFRMG